MSSVVDRLIRYCSIPSQANPLVTEAVPSTISQFVMAEAVRDDLNELNALDVTLDNHAYVTARWPASPGYENLPTLAFLCHLDTAPQSWGDHVRPQVVRYEGGELTIGTGRNGRPVTISPTTNPELSHMVGWDLVTADGTSLLGGDDKAGIAAVLELLARLKADPTLPHPRLAIAFTPDEEIGHGAALLDLDAFGASWGYTIDGGPLGEICYETFNAAETQLTAHGVSVHPGSAKGVMINAVEAIMRFHQLLPAAERPEYTEGYDGFYFLDRVDGSCEEANATYIIRDHNQSKVEARKEVMRAAAALINSQIGREVIELSIHDQYHNLADVVTQPENAHLITNARAAFEACGIKPFTTPMRGGTDGSQLSFRGLPCVNLSACYHNAHGVREFVPVPELEALVDVLVALVARYAIEQEDIASIDD